MHVYGKSLSETFGYATLASLTLNPQAFSAAALNMAGAASALGALLSMNPTFQREETTDSVLMTCKHSNLNKEWVLCCLLHATSTTGILLNKEWCCAGRERFFTRAPASGMIRVAIQAHDMHA